MNREPDFVLRADDEPHLAKIAPRLVEALRGAHAGDHYKVAAIKLNIPLGTFKSRVHRARFQVMKLRTEAEIAARVDQLQRQAVA